MEQLLCINGQTNTASVSANKINGVMPIDSNSWSNMSSQRLSEECEELKLWAIQMVIDANPFQSVVLESLENEQNCIVTSE